MKKRFISILLLSTLVLGVFSLPAAAAGAGGSSSSDYAVQFDDCSAYTMYSADDTVYKSFTYSFTANNEAYVMVVIDFKNTIKENSFLDLIVDFNSSNYYDNVVLECLELHEAGSSVTGGQESFEYGGIVSGKSIIFSVIINP